MFELAWAYICVLLFAAIPFFEVIAVIPIAIFAGLATLPVMLLAFIGNLVTVILVILSVNKIKEWRKSRKENVEEAEDEENKSSKRSARARKIWKRYGLPGLALIGPFFVGSHLTAFMSVTLGGTKKRTSIWMTYSLVLWSVIFAFLAHYGVDFIFERTGQEGFLMRYFNQE